MKKKATTLDSISSVELELVKKEDKVYVGAYKSYPSCIKAFPKAIEIEQLQQVVNIRHPNFPIFYGSSVTDRIENSKFLTVTELLEGCISMKLNAINPPSLFMKMKWAKEVALGLTWLHCNKPPIFVKTLKTSNLLFDNLNRVKVNWINEFISNSISEPSLLNHTVYTAPELMKDEEVTEKVDVYSFGVILLELFFNKTPTRDMCEHTSKIPFVNCPQLLKDLILGCLHVNAYQRPSFPLIVDRMEKILEESRIYDEEQRLKSIFNHRPAEQFWKMHFSFKTTVNWSEFASAYYSHFNHSLPSSADLLSVNHPSSFFTSVILPSPCQSPSLPHLSSLSSSSSPSLTSLSSSPSSSFLLSSFPSSSPSSPSLSSSPSSSFLSSSPSSSFMPSSPLPHSHLSSSPLSSPLSSPSLSTFYSPSSPRTPPAFLHFSPTASSPISIAGQSAERSTRRDYKYSTSIRRYFCLKHCLVQRPKAGDQPIKGGGGPKAENNTQNKEQAEGEEEEEFVVSAERLSKLIKYFGPFDDKLLKRIEKLFANKWFAFDMTSTIAEKTLLPYTHYPGTFLIRLSHNTPGAYCISYTHRGARIVHTLFPYSTDGRFSYANESFSSLPQLVEYLTSKGVLSRPLSISKYSWLFEYE